ncbi:endonuclease/exonuclease/phosphatase family protein [Promethearchaeum syntrophicum]|uniref:Endonuclease/exonuclease/phosphatase family protein n=1 Tax=Promethearchaeum syntrophicum TaxID=2594042 RepID=A0A5B9DCN7_9ARCH|nr:endonuclease/exonuclease/phosphatase family protein [Candidatus Prometheoarchaeum syntrophicum]QEE16882.1 Endonuclease/Exonuclease/phosphatase family protein [Candidatus Prometheoarchaeum syntrophicum]
MEQSKKFLDKINIEMILLSVLFLFFLQMITELISAIYMLDLLNTSVDEKAAGLLFLLPSIFLIFTKKDYSMKLIKISGIVLIVARLITPLVATLGKIITAGFGVGAFMIFFPSYLLFSSSITKKSNGLNYGLSLAIGTGLSILFRTLNYTIDISMYSWYQSIGGILAIIGLFSLLSLEKLNESNHQDETNQNKEVDDELPINKNTNGNFKKGIKVFLLIIGIINTFLLIYFAFEGPTVISRWTQGNYLAIIIILTIMISIYALITLFKPQWFGSLKNWMIWLWNFLFSLSLVLTIFVHTIKFPETPSSPAIIVAAPYWYQQIPLYVMLLLSPIIFINFMLLTRELININPLKRQISLGFTLGGFVIIIMAFIIIFTNIWGYVGAISLVFRNLFWLPFLLIGIGLFISTLLIKKSSIQLKKFQGFPKKNLSATIFICFILIGTILGGIITTSTPETLTGQGVNSLKIMTFNVQMGVNESGDKNYESQLRLIQEINPDIIALQESDSAKIGGGNSDVVRFFADKLNYYSYYGPKKVTGTYGAAILSRYPISNAISIFTYSDEDEIGTVQAQITVGENIFNVFNSHPDGSAEAKLTHIQTLMSRIEGLSNVISLGDFNSRENSTYYNASTALLVDSFLSLYPDHFDENDVNRTRRIDHIFVSPEFIINEAHYISSPESQTDHPVYWISIEF